MEARTVLLTECRDLPRAEGGVLLPGYVYPLEITEAASCRCQACTI